MLKLKNFLKSILIIVFFTFVFDWVYSSGIGITGGYIPSGNNWIWTGSGYEQINSGYGDDGHEWKDPAIEKPKKEKPKIPDGDDGKAHPGEGAGTGDQTPEDKLRGGYGGNNGKGKDEKEQKIDIDGSTIDDGSTENQNDTQQNNSEGESNTADAAAITKDQEQTTTEEPEWDNSERSQGFNASGRDGEKHKVPE